jgi:uncharacterized membrane protein YdjX (TVP38/TMEM64 family)
MTEGPLTLALSLPSVLLSSGFGAFPDWASSLGGAHLAAAQLFALVVGVLPASALAVAAGATLGIGAGIALSSATLLFGATVTFFLSRSLFRPLIKRWVGERPRAAAFDEALGREGWRFVCLLRVSPVAPFVATSYLLGLSKVSFRDYLLGTLASLPALAGYVVIGALAARGIRFAVAQNWMGGAVLLVGVLATALLTVKIGGVIAKALKGATVE